MRSPGTLPPPLPADARRVLVAGMTASGKSTMAAALSERLGLPHTDPDQLRYGSGWAVRPEFHDDLRETLATDRWVLEHAHPEVKAAQLAAADTVVWLDHVLPVIAWRLVRRSCARWWARPGLVNGNHDQVRGWVQADSLVHVLTGRAFAERRRRTGEELAAAASRGVVVIRLRGPRQADRWLAAVPSRP